MLKKTNNVSKHTKLIPGQLAAISNGDYGNNTKIPFGHITPEKLPTGTIHNKDPYALYLSDCINMQTYPAESSFSKKKLRLNLGI